MIPPLVMQMDGGEEVGNFGEDMDMARTKGWKPQHIYIVHWERFSGCSYRFLTYPLHMLAMSWRSSTYVVAKNKIKIKALKSLSCLRVAGATGQTQIKEG